MFEAVKGDIPFRGMTLPQIILYVANGNRLRPCLDGCETCLAEARCESRAVIGRGLRLLHFT